MNVIHVTLMIWAVPCVAPNTLWLTETNVSSIFGNESDFDSEEESSEESSDSEYDEFYAEAHAGILDREDRGHIFSSQSGEIPTCSIVAIHENATVQLKARCLSSSEEWVNATEIPMRTITEEAENVWAEPSAEIIELIEQFKNETVLYKEKIGPLQSENILKLATIYSKMHPESANPHVHIYDNLQNFGVHI